MLNYLKKYKCDDLDKCNWVNMDTKTKYNIDQKEFINLMKKSVDYIGKDLSLVPIVKSNDLIYIQFDLDDCNIEFNKLVNIIDEQLMLIFNLNKYDMIKNVYWLKNNSKNNYHGHYTSIVIHQYDLWSIYLTINNAFIKYNLKPPLDMRFNLIRPDLKPSVGLRLTQFPKIKNGLLISNTQYKFISDGKYNEQYYKDTWIWTNKEITKFTNNFKNKLDIMRISMNFGLLFNNSYIK